jgi:RimJ/RimL family protein N-acetyltransferase
MYRDDNDMVLRPVMASDLTQQYLGWLREASGVLGGAHLPKTIRELRADLRLRHAPPASFLFAIIDGGKHVGNISLHVDLRHQRGEVGVIVGKVYQGRGVATKAHLLMLQMAFGELGLRKVWAGYRSDNAASKALYSWLGFHVEGTLRQHDVINNQVVDVVRVGILAQEWNT